MPGRSIVRKERKSQAILGLTPINGKAAVSSGAVFVFLCSHMLPEKQYWKVSPEEHLQLNRKSNVCH